MIKILKMEISSFSYYWREFIGCFDEFSIGTIACVMHCCPIALWHWQSGTLDRDYY